MLDDVVAWLYVPGIRPDLYAKAAAVADGVVIDLEDAVHPDARGAARKELAPLADTRLAVPTVVRVNPVGTMDFYRDLEVLHPLGQTGAVAGLRLSKVESPDQVAEAAALTSSWPAGLRLVCQLESAAAVHAAYDVASAPAVHSLMLGEGDLRADLRLPRGRAGDPGLALARQTVVMASRGAGLASPVGAAFTNVADAEGLAASSTELAALGFYGRSCIHPQQVDAVREAFRPSEDDLAWARNVTQESARMHDDLNASSALPDGSFIDPAIRKHAETVLARTPKGAG